MRIGILGSGLMGGAVGKVLARAGHEIIFSYARTKGKLARLAAESEGNASAGTVAEAARAAEAIFLAVHWSRVDDVLEQAGNLAGKPVISCCLPMDGESIRLILGTSTSGAEDLARRLQGAHVVSAFNSIPSEVIAGVFAARHSVPRPSLVYCGDHASAKQLAAQLIRDAGFDPLDAGPLTSARFTEPFALLVAKLAYGGKQGPELAYRFEHIGP